jgi:sugar lactone lactonase YvrE
MPRLGRQTTLPPQIDNLTPSASLPGGEVELHGSHLGPYGLITPSVTVDGLDANLLLSRSARLRFRVPHRGSEGIIQVRNADGPSNTTQLRIARLLSDGLHPVTSPVVSRSGMTFATISGSRGKQTPVSIVRISPDRVGTPFVSGILNPTGLAFDPHGDLFVTSRAEGAVYRIDAGGEATTYAEGMGTATGCVFDPEGNLYVGDRSGTIFKIAPGHTTEAPQIFVYATLEPSVAAYHLALGSDGTLYVTAPSLSANDCIWAIDRDGSTSAWFRGLGRPQGLALDADENIYVTGSYQGRRGLIRITQDGRAELVLSGNELVGIAFSPLGTAALATNDSVYDVDLGVEGLRLF